MISDLVNLSPDENSKLLQMIFETYKQPFSVIEVKKVLNQKQVVIQLRSGIRKTYQVFPNGHIQLKRGGHA